MQALNSEREDEVYQKMGEIFSQIGPPREIVCDNVSGISDVSIAEFFLDLSAKSLSETDLEDRIQKTETLDVGDPLVLEFHERRSRRTKAYQLLSDEDEEIPKKRKKKKKKASKDVQEEEDDIDKMEREREEDLKERDAFAKRMLAKDKEKTRKVTEKSDSRAYAEAAKRLEIEASDKDKMVPELRKESRRAYLAKRKVDKLVELEDDVQDDEFLFEKEILTEKEIKERDYKKTILALSKEHDKAAEVEKVHRYHMPDGSKNELDSYVEVDEKRKGSPL
ncbi:DHX16 [Lepeophtheirus salmonis]|uniref:DHX16 n=1 Tax=Lepeophtheirus salmonis TaxID=72036 RepID=A0A7R8CS29_LEPSM|nr:DHX16 [Lepeophtheirus salmonis]CAF2912360.1 DHX16 [Lepeophtheirus salmonis]